MEFDCTKEGKNIYFACREKAAKYNDLLNSRDKIIADALNKIAYHDDTQIVDCQVRKFYSDDPRVEVRILDIKSPVNK